MDDLDDDALDDILNDEGTSRQKRRRTSVNDSGTENETNLRPRKKMKYIPAIEVGVQYAEIVFHAIVLDIYYHGRFSFLLLSILRCILDHVLLQSQFRPQQLSLVSPTQNPAQSLLQSRR
jgi:hypothetical protein